MTWADTNIPSQRHARSGATALRRGAYVTGFVAAGFVGRATIVDDQALALIWPAAGVALLWFLGGPEGRWSWADVALLAAATFTVNGLTGSTPAAAGILVVANVVQVVTIVALTHRWAPELSGREQHRTLDNPATLSRFILAISAGAAIGTAIGVAGLAAITGFFSVEATLTWWGRNVCGALAVAATGILLTHRVLQHRGGLPLRPYPTARMAELGALVACTSALFFIDLASAYLPLAFFLPAMTAWAGMRFSSSVVALHALAGGGAAVALTLVGQGPFAAVESLQLSALLSQLFVGMTVVLGLYLAMSRAEAARLNVELQQANLHEADQRELLEAIIGSMSDGVVVVDRRGIVVMSNPAAADLLASPTLALGSDAAEQTLYVDRSHLTSIGTPRHSDTATEVLDLTRIPQQRTDVTLSPHDDNRVLAVAATPLRSPGADHRTAVIVIQDVTGDRLHQRELANFAGIVAHDLLNPIASISGWSTLLAEALETQDHRGPELAMAQRIYLTAARMDELVHDLLADTRARDRELNLGTVDPAALLRDIAHVRNVEAHLTIDELPLLLADGVLIRQLLDNLIGNAIKYAHPDRVPHVSVNGTHLEGHILLTITDNGLGIPPGHHDKVFERFHRAHTDTHTGTGLGLAICHAIVERHSGRIRAIPNPTHGTTIEVTLPDRPA